MRYRSNPKKETIMAWETPIVEEIACGMEVTAYAPADDGREADDPTVRQADQQDA
jgi:coenzyme PQQ precursor peptide PqqA